MTYKIPTSYTCYVCSNCGQATPNPEDDGYGNHSCASCEMGNFSSFERQATYVSVAVYQTIRSYGGPEEGGWWYDYHIRLDETIRHYEIGDLPQAELYRERLIDLHSVERTRYGDNRYTVMNFCDQVPAVKLPRVTPRYC